MKLIQAATMQQAWKELLFVLMHYYEYKPAPRGHKTREILGVTFRVDDMRNNILSYPVRNLNAKFLCAEWLWISLGREDLATLTKYNGQMSRFSDDGKTLAGAYGPRLASQWTYVAESIRQDMVSRQAVATIWTPNPSPSKDIPCTISLQFIARECKLNLIVTMRSSDIWLGLPYDLFTFSMIGNAMAGELKLEPGFIQFNLGSSHLYEDNLEKASELLDEPLLNDHLGITSPRLPGWPSQGGLGLELKLSNPDSDVMPLYEPWITYAKVLASPTWKEAYAHLHSLEEN